MCLRLPFVWIVNYGLDRLVHSFHEERERAWLEATKNSVRASSLLPLRFHFVLGIFTGNLGIIFEFFISYSTLLLPLSLSLLIDVTPTLERGVAALTTADNDFICFVCPTSCRLILHTYGCWHWSCQAKARYDRCTCRNCSSQIICTSCHCLCHNVLNAQIARHLAFFKENTTSIFQQRSLQTHNWIMKMFESS